MKPGHPQQEDPARSGARCGTTILLREGVKGGNNNSSTTATGTHCAGTPLFCYPPAALKSLISSKNNSETIYITLFDHKIAMPTVSADTCVADGSELGPQGPICGLR